QINFKGDDRAGRSEIRGGNIGVNNTGFAERGEPRLTMCLGPGDGLNVVMDPHTQVVADTAKLGGACDVWDVFVTKLEASGHTPHTNSVNGGWYPVGAPEPLITSLPPFPAFTCAPSPHVTFKNTTLPPGNYGNVSIEGSVSLGAGTYTFCDLHVERGARLATTNATVIQVQGALRVPGGSIGSAQSCDANIFVKADLPRDMNGVAFGRGSEIFGQLWAPNADVALGHSTDLHGHFWAKSMTSDRGVNVTGCGTTAATTTSTSTTTTAPETSTTETTLPDP
ncbi:MAG TPA: hypothetical protein VFX21_06650, partial [Acidimicrobiia bacterium]|nr:hypothetical protein [Acidimicrobiia bacterium]